MSAEKPDEGEQTVEEQIDRLEEIAEILEEGEVGLEQAKELREEADDHLEALRNELDVGDGEIIEIDGSHPDGS